MTIGELKEQIATLPDYTEVLIGSGKRELLSSVEWIKQGNDYIALEVSNE